MVTTRRVVKLLAEGKRINELLAGINADKPTDVHAAAPMSAKGETEKSAAREGATNSSVQTESAFRTITMSQIGAHPPNQ